MCVHLEAADRTRERCWPVALRQRAYVHPHRVADQFVALRCEHPAAVHLVDRAPGRQYTLAGREWNVEAPVFVDVVVATPGDAHANGAAVLDFLNPESNRGRRLEHG